ncbi:MAG TPA: hypothetical protein VLG44_08205 [Chlamydiales bacterium]|nr:hypothetical protein [Chlamydiales bacterium]
MAAPSNGVGKPPILSSSKPVLIRSQSAVFKRYQPSSRVPKQTAAKPPEKAASEVKDKQAATEVERDDFKLDQKLLEESKAAYDFAMETLAMLSKSYSKKP